VRFTALAESFAICQLSAQEDVPRWAFKQKTFVSVSYTADELSIVCPEAQVPSEVKCERGWRAIKLLGPLDLNLVGILAELATELSTDGVPIFAISTFDTDYLLVPGSWFRQAKSTLEWHRHVFE
jgi:uncharacterized protein